jgi:hypothetical protein
MSDISLAYATVSLDFLYLDPRNPRLKGVAGAPVFKGSFDAFSRQGQELLRRQMMQREGAHHLADSITRLGFVDVDSIVVQKLNEHSYVVIEGNRRVAAIKTLMNDILRKSICLAEDIVNTFSPLHVKILKSKYEDGSIESLLLQGIRHISGAKSWGPYQQGDLINSLIEHKGLTASDAAKTVGLSASRVSIILKAYFGLRQMFNHYLYQSKANTAFFSHFEYAYVKYVIREWLGWNDKSQSYTNEDAYEIFCYRITLPTDDKLAISARDIRDILPIVLSYKTAREEFINGEPLSSAFSLCSVHDDKLDKFIYNIGLIMKNKSELNSLALTQNGREKLMNLHSLIAELLKVQ